MRPTFCQGPIRRDCSGTQPWTAGRYPFLSPSSPCTAWGKAPGGRTFGPDCRDAPAIGPKATKPWPKRQHHRTLLCTWAFSFPYLGGELLYLQLQQRPAARAQTTRPQPDATHIISALYPDSKTIFSLFCLFNGCSRGQNLPQILVSSGDNAPGFDLDALD